MKNMNLNKRGNNMSFKSTVALTYYYQNFHHNLWHICYKLHFLQHMKYFSLALAFNLLERPFISTSMYAPEVIDIVL